MAQNTVQSSMATIAKKIDARLKKTIKKNVHLMTRYSYKRETVLKISKFCETFCKIMTQKNLGESF